MNYVPNILAFYPTPTDATSLYRGKGPFSKLHRLMNLNIHDVSGQQQISLNWAVLSKMDLVFFQRPFKLEHMRAIRMAKANNVPVWIDYDDILLEEYIPDSNPAKRFFQNPADRKDMLETISTVDLITVTTEKLKELLSDFVEEDKILIIPNAFDDYKWKFDYRFSEKGLIQWRGSSTHADDIMSVADALANVKKANPKWLFHFMGDDAKRLEGKFDFKFSEPCDVIEYFRRIEQYNPRIQIVPLIDSDFNRCKSNIAWIEGTYSGATCLAPKIPEFEKPGIVNYVTEKDFEENLDKMIHSTNLEDFYKASWEYITENLLLSNVNTMRINVIKQLLDM